MQKERLPLSFGMNCNFIFIRLSVKGSFTIYTFGTIPVFRLLKILIHNVHVQVR